ncbi:PepSY-associated TM helix domain-containing protein [Sphingopyxis sp.]|uniref:PepSY-associated TM helix domain-containing protein n=1 Tax=Sphingopyxis sp. TaxID=1908224 RepID=UPI002D764DD1|nr:PepSY-associated TM helix domain-containing protein [Sphingopyxis sp.]HET6524626.1 PepSY-associated TM helix domain-containing protein [Sphingopyxis sp.]
MAGAAVRRRPRHALKLWHRWFGLLAGLWLALLAATGIAVTFYDELDSALNADWRTVPAPARAAPVGDAVAAAGRALPGFAPDMIEIPGHEGDTLWMMGRAPVGGVPTRVQLFSDPRDGSVLGWRETGAIVFDRRHAMDIIYGLHIDLLAGPWMTWFFGLVSLLWVIDHAIAAALTFPKGMHWLRAFRIEGRRGSLKRLFDSHRAWGLWLLPVTLVLAVTGVTLSWPDDSREAVGFVSPVTGRLHESMADVPESAPAVDVDTAIARVVGEAGERVHSVRLFPDHGVYAVRTFDARDRDDQGRLWHYVAMDDGRVVGTRHDNGTTAGDEFFAWQYPLHSGKAFGLIGRLLVLLGGVVTLWLCLSGIKLWWRRRRQRI